MLTDPAASAFILTPFLSAPRHNNIFSKATRFLHQTAQKIWYCEKRCDVRSRFWRRLQLTDSLVTWERRCATAGCSPIFISRGKTHKKCLHRTDKIQQPSTSIHSILIDTIMQTHAHAVVWPLPGIENGVFLAVMKSMAVRLRLRLSVRVMEKFSFNSVILLLISCLTSDDQDLLL